MQTGRYGLQFDDQESSPVRWLVWVVWVIVGLAVITLIIKGCSSGKGKEDGDIETASYGKQETPKVERAPFFKGVFDKGRGEESRGDIPPPPSFNEPIGRHQAAESAARPARSSEVRKLLDQALALENKDDLLGARDILWGLLERKEASDVMGFVRKRLGKINKTLLFSDRPMPEKVRHVIASGDLVSRLSKRYDNTQTYIFKANSIENPSQLRIGREIWVINKPDFLLSVHKRTFRAVLSLNGKFFKEYAVGIGEAPSGSYRIRSRVEKPVYRRPGERTIPYGAPGNILGKWRFLLDPADEGSEVSDMGFHGTWDDSSIGRKNEDGTIRFSNADAAELAVILPNGTRVEVLDE